MLLCGTTNKRTIEDGATQPLLYSILMSCDSILLAWPQLNGMPAALHSCISHRVHTKSKLCRIDLLLLHVFNLINNIWDAACQRYVWKARRLPGWSPQASCWQVGNSQVKMGGGGLYPIHHTLPHMFTCWLSICISVWRPVHCRMQIWLLLLT